MLDNAESPAALRDAAESLGALVAKHITDSFGGNLYGRAIEELRVMRDEMIEVEEPGVYNSILRKLKEKLVKEELGGDRKDFWYEVRKNRLGLVDNKASERSDVGEDEAKEVSCQFKRERGSTTDRSYSSIRSGDVWTASCACWLNLHISRRSLRTHLPGDTEVLSHAHLSNWIATNWSSEAFRRQGAVDRK